MQKTRWYLRTATIYQFHDWSVGFGPHKKIIERHQIQNKIFNKIDPAHYSPVDEIEAYYNQGQSDFHRLWQKRQKKTQSGQQQIEQLFVGKDVKDER